MLSCRDVSNITENAKLVADNKMLNMVSSSVNHEMITPIKCTLQILNKIEKKIIHPKTLSDIKLIKNTSTLLLSHVKSKLDYNLLALD